MADVITVNDALKPHTLIGQTGRDIYLGLGNLTGSLTTTAVPLPDIPPRPGPVEPTEVTYINQIGGFVALTPCEDPECREFSESLYINPVFADLTTTDPYFNDTSTFIINFNAWYSLGFTTTITLQQLIAGVWTDVAVLNDNTYGTYIPYNTYYLLPSYTGYIINWYNVLDEQGEGIYRIKFEIEGRKIDECLVSEAFCLKAFDCFDASKTVKFEATLFGGYIGHAINPAILINLCGFTFTDSIRFKGFFGYEKAEYERKNVEYNNGIIYKIRDEVIKQFILFTGKIPKSTHDRFKAYGLMADKQLVSDYNYNNPDYQIKRKGVVCDGGYEPLWVQNSRRAKVKVAFKEDQQNLIRRRCCER